MDFKLIYYQKLFGRQTLMIMKLSFLLIFLSLLQLSANSYSQSVKIKLDTDKQYTIKELFQAIENKTSYRFFYNDELTDLNKTVSLIQQDIQVKDLLHLILDETSVSYRLLADDMIIVAPKEVLVQGITVTGTVTDSNGEPMPGVNVIVKGSLTGVVTDINGNYTIRVPDKSAALVFSFVGFNTHESPIGDLTKINVTMDESSRELEEVVVVGYGTSKRRDLTGAVSSVSSKQLKDIPVTSAAVAIAGKMPGVQVTQTEGSPDAEIKIRVRGGGSITQDNSPLYIVDGFPVDNLNSIAPTDIASIDVLKDASSTAIYGARGANGVIIVTTKSGYEGKASVKYNTYYGQQKITGYYDVLDPYEFVFWQYELQGNVDSFEKLWGKFTDMPLYKDMTGTNWQKEILGQTGHTLYNNLSISGGTRDVRYNLSVTRSDEKAIMLDNGQSKTNFAGKVFFKINNWLNVDMNLMLSDQFLKGAGTSGNQRLQHVVQFRPVNGLRDLVDTDFGTDDYDIISTNTVNPLEQTNDDYRRNSKQSFSYNGAFNIKFLKNFTYRFAFGMQYSKETNKRFYGIHTSNALNTGTQPLAENQKDDTRRWQITNTVNYDKRDFLPGHNLNILIGEELVSKYNERLRGSVKYLPKYIDPVGALAMLNLGLADAIYTFDDAPDNLSSFFGRLHYDYKGKYMIDGVFRADGSSKFAPGNQWGFFPSVSAAWRISDESFMESTKAWLVDLKIRGSYGESGNNRVGDDLWRKTLSVATGRLFMDGGAGSPTPYLNPSGTLANPNMKWETTVTRNIGVDFTLFKHRLSGTVDLYKNSTKDLLISANIPPDNGYSNQMQNIGETSNKGIELSLSGTIIEKRDFRLSASFNIAFNKNKIEKLGSTKSWEQSSGWAGSDGPTGDFYIYEGGKVGLMYGYITDGMYSVDDFSYDGTQADASKYKLNSGVANNSGLISARYFRPGCLKFVNQNPGDGDSVDAANDKVVIGDANPIHTGGFNISAEYKGFDFSAFFNWVYGNDIYNANKLNYTNYWGGRQYKNILQTMNSNDRFIIYSPETGALVNDPTELQALNQGKKYWTASMSRAPLHSWVIEDGSFLRLNNVTLGYSLPKKIVSKFKIEQLRVYVTGYNLWIWTNYSGYDPEVDGIRSTPLTPGVDWNNYPKSRSYNIGLNLTF